MIAFAIASAFTWCSPSPRAAVAPVCIALIVVGREIAYQLIAVLSPAGADAPQSLRGEINLTKPRPADDLVLKVPIQLDEISTVTRHPYHQAAVLGGVGLGLAQSLRGDHIKLHVGNVQAAEAAQQLHELAQRLLALKEGRQDFMLSRVPLKASERLALLNELSTAVGAQSWALAPELQSLMTRTVRDANAPIFYHFQNMRTKQDDFSLPRQRPNNAPENKH